MAENESEKTEQPTPKRLEEARKKGQIPRSTELSAAAVILAVGGGLHFLGGYMGSRLNGLMMSSLSLTREQSVDESLMISTMTTEAAHALIALAPILGLTLIVALLAPMLLGGWNLSFEALAPDFTRAGSRATCSLDGFEPRGGAVAIEKASHLARGRRGGGGPDGASLVYSAIGGGNRQHGTSRDLSGGAPSQEPY